MSVTHIQGGGGWSVGPSPASGMSSSYLGHMTDEFWPTTLGKSISTIILKALEKKVNAPKKSNVGSRRTNSSGWLWTLQALFPTSLRPNGHNKWARVTKGSAAVTQREYRLVARAPSLGRIPYGEWDICWSVARSYLPPNSNWHLLNNGGVVLWARSFLNYFSTCYNFDPFGSITGKCNI